MSDESVIVNDIELSSLRLEVYIQKLQTEWKKIENIDDGDQTKVINPMHFIFIVGKEGCGKLSCVHASFDKSKYFPVTLNMLKKEDRIRCEDEIRFLFNNRCIGAFAHGQKKNNNAIVLNRLDYNKVNQKTIKGLIKFVTKMKSTKIDRQKHSCVPMVFIYCDSNKYKDNNKKWILIKELIRLCDYKIRISFPEKKDIKRWIMLILKKINIPNVRKYITKEDIKKIYKTKNIHTIKQQIFEVIYSNREKMRQKDIRSFMVKI